MKEKGTHEGCIEQINRLFKNNVYGNSGSQRDEHGRVRIDDLEMERDVQQAITKLWASVNTENLGELTDIEGYRDEFHRLFGFGVVGIDYSADVDPVVKIESIGVA